MTALLLVWALVAISSSARTPAATDSSIEDSDSSDRATLRTGGFPSGPFFEVTLEPSGRLEALKRSLPVTKEGKLTEVRATVDLAPHEAETLFDEAAQLKDFAVGCDEVADGTNAVLIVRRDAVETRRGCNGAAEWPQGKDTKSWLRRLNDHLPATLAVF